VREGRPTERPVHSWIRSKEFFNVIKFKRTSRAKKTDSTKGSKESKHLINNKLEPVASAVITGKRGQRTESKRVRKRIRKLKKGGKEGEKKCEYMKS